MMRSLFLFLLLASGLVSSAQPDTTTPAFRRYQTLPPLQLLLQDSATKYTKADLPKKTPVLVVLFSPDCEHCQQEAEQIAARKEEFKKIHVVMASTYPLHRLKEFADKYGLTGMDNVVVAKDLYYLLPSFYAIRHFPYLALYNKKGDLIDAFEGAVNLDKVLALFNKGK